MRRPWDRTGRGKPERQRLGEKTNVFLHLGATKRSPVTCLVCAANLDPRSIVKWPEWVFPSGSYSLIDLISVTLRWWEEEAQLLLQVQTPIAASLQCCPPALLSTHQELLDPRFLCLPAGRLCLPSRRLEGQFSHTRPGVSQELPESGSCCPQSSSFYGVGYPHPTPGASLELEIVVETPQQQTSYHVLQVSNLLLCPSQAPWNLGAGCGPCLAHCASTI